MADAVLADLVLASASPRRRELLGQLGLVLEVTPANVDETPLPDEHPREYVRRVAAAKCDAVATLRGATLPALPAIPVLAADTIVIVDDQIFGQPTDEADARRMLQGLGGGGDSVPPAPTAACISSAGKTCARAVPPGGSFRSLQPAELDAYVASDEWRGKAGGYA